MTQQTRETRETPETAVPQSAADAPACPRRSPGLAQGWCALSALHGRIESHIERALQATHDLSVREFSVLNVLSEQHDGPGGHLRMNQVADSVVLSQSA